MNSSIAFLVLLFAGIAFADLVFSPGPAGQNDRLLIDDFTSGVGQGFIQVFDAGDTANLIDYFPDISGGPAPNILGGERDLNLVVTKVEATNSITSRISQISSRPVNEQNFWEVATPLTITGFSTLQWDGSDDRVAAPRALSTTGLGGIDFTDGGNNRHIHIRLSRDIGSVFDFNVASVSGTCSYSLLALGTDGDTGAILDIWIPFADFSAGCSFTSVGGFEIIIRQEPNVDASLFLVALSGSAPSQSQTPTPTPTRPPTDSNTPTPTSLPSQSRTPTPLPSASRTPTPTGTGTRTPTPIPSESRTPTPTPTQTRTPTPTPSPECICICPAFTCALIFDPDDDVNNVYYFTGPGFTFPDQPDDDDNLVTNSLTVSLGDSGASVLTVSIALVAVIVALF